MEQDLPLILEDFLHYMESIRGLSPNTIREYRYDLSNFLRFLRKRRDRLQYGHTHLDQIPIDDLTEDDLAQVRLNDMHAYLSYSPARDANSPARRARKIASIRSFYKYMVNVEEYFEKNPAEKLTTPKRKQRHPVYLTLEEALHLIETAAKQENRFLKYRDVAILVTFLTTGIRLSELCGMNVTSLKEDSFNVVGKGNKERTIYITDSCGHALEEYLKVRPKNPQEPALFLSTRKQRISTRAVQHRIEKLLQEAGFDTRIYSTHKLRHTAATLMYKEGVDIRTLQRILGHSSVATTQIYTHVEDDLVKKAMKKNPLASLPSSDSLE